MELSKASDRRYSHRRSLAALDPYGTRADGLKSVARYLVERKN